MPLQDAFKKKQNHDTKAEAFKVAPLRTPPSMEDLKFCMEQSRKQVGRPSALSWMTESDTYILTATHSYGTYEPTWILHVGAETISAIAWRHTSSDVELVHNLLEAAKPPEPGKAVIPEFLRPGYQAEKLASSLPSQGEFTENCELISRLGAGGMGVIYKAKRKDTDELVALKVLHGHLMDEEENQKRFMREAKACLDLKHRNLINVYEFGVSKHGQPYMLMEYLEGQSLTDVIEQSKRLEIPRFINLFLQICDGLRYAHEKNVVHRDVKPSNIMVLRSEGQETAKVLDFGIAKIINETDQNELTPTGNIVGSPAYISPEQAAGAKADPRIDVYSLGCVMYEALAGHPPFVHESSIKVLMMQLGDPPPPLSSVCPEGFVPPKLEQIVMRCLEKNPDKRYPSASDLGADLFIFATSRNRAQGSSELDVIPAKVPHNVNTTQVPNAATHASSEITDSLNSNAVPSSLAKLKASAAKASTAAGVMPATSDSKYALTIRFRKCKSNEELDSVFDGLCLAGRIQARDLQVSVFLDSEATIMIMHPDIILNKLKLDAQISKRITGMQALLQQILKNGGQIIASKRWAKQHTDDKNRHAMPGSVLLNDEDVCDFILERSGAIIDY